MYESFYGLAAKPFAVVPDPKFIYWTGVHRLAFVMLEYGILSRAGFTVVTGEVGAGKTTLLRYLLSKLPDDVDVRVISNMRGGKDDLLQWILMAFEQEFEGRSHVAMYKVLRDFLTAQHALGRRTVLIIDEAQHLGADALEELRMISNINTSEEGFLQVVLSGQPELKTILSVPEMEQFRQRVSSDFHLPLLSTADVHGYIEHRLKVAGADKPLFTPEAINMIAEAGKRTPRVINILCDTALLYGYAVDAPVVNTQIVERVLQDRKEYGVFQVQGDLLHQ